MVEPVKKTGGSAPAAESEPIDPEVPAKATRRKFTAQYKLDILAQAERCESGEVGALLRREGLYSSHLTTWRRQCEEGALAALTPRKRGREAKAPDAQTQRLEALERENERLRQRLAQAETLIEVQKKVSALLGMPLKPELLTTAPNQLWSWDFTKLKWPAKWTYFYLYVILDVFSRCVVGWMVATCESAALAEKLIRESCAKQAIPPGQLTLHADRGSSMTSKAVVLLLSDLGVTKTHSRPYLSNDNPFSEAQFKTLKYRPNFPPSFGSLEDARSHCRAFFHWYNHEHRHSGIAYLTPHDLHTGRAEAALDARAQALAAGFEAHPARFKGRPPETQRPPAAVWINPPTQAADDAQEAA